MLVNVTLEEKIYLLEDSPGITASLVCYLLMCQIFSFIFLPIIIWYEIDGEDPQKRTILNQMFSFQLLLIILHNAFPGSVLVFRLIYRSGLNYNVTLIFLIWAKIFTSITALLSVLQYIITKYLSICVWKRVPPIDELFFGKFLFIANCIIGAFLAMIQIFTSTWEVFLLKFITGLDFDVPDTGPKVR